MTDFCQDSFKRQQTNTAGTDTVRRYGVSLFCNGKAQAYQKSLVYLLHIGG